VGHRLQLLENDIVDRLGIRVTSQARTWCDLASMLAEEDLLAAGDFLIWRRRDPELRLAPDDLRLAIRNFAGRRGTRALNSAEPELTDRSDSPPESKIRLRAVRYGLPTLDINPELYDGNGRFLAMPDLAFIHYRMALDYEGDHHRTEAEQWEKDISRVPRLQDAGWHHTRIAKTDLRDSTQLLARLSRLLRERGWDGRPPEIRP
jgi:hypothetical protein